MNLPIVLLFLKLTSARFRRKLDISVTRKCVRPYISFVHWWTIEKTPQNLLETLLWNTYFIEIWHFMTVFIFKEKESYHLDASTD